MHGQDRSADKARAINGQRVVVALKLFTPPVPRRASVPGVKGNRMNCLSGDRGDILGRDTGINHSLMAAVKVEVVDDPGLIVSMRHFAGFNAMTSRIWTAKVLRRHEREGIRVQAEVKIGTDGMALINEPDTGLIYRMGR